MNTLDCSAAYNCFLSASHVFKCMHRVSHNKDTSDTSLLFYVNKQVQAMTAQFVYQTTRFVYLLHYRSIIYNNHDVLSFEKSHVGCIYLMKNAVKTVKF